MERYCFFRNKLISPQKDSVMAHLKQLNKLPTPYSLHLYMR
jgi:hypothetical protein